MTSTDVREVVKNCFSGFNLESFKYLRANGANYLEMVDKQDMNGDEVVDLTGCGCLYVTDNMSEVSGMLTVTQLYCFRSACIMLFSRVYIS